MKEELKLALVAISGAAVGGGLSYIITKAFLQKKHKKQLDDISAVVSKMQEKEHKAELIEQEAKEEYNKVLDDLTKNAVDSINTKLKEAKECIRTVGNEEFLHTDYDIEYLHYYVDNGIVTDNRDTYIERPEALLGPFYGDFFENCNGGIVHIVNDSIKVKYSVEVCTEPYGDDISIPEVDIFPIDDDDEEDY